MFVDHSQKINKEYRNLNKKKLDKTCLPHDMANTNFKDLIEKLIKLIKHLPII